ncbi:hypothetical protein KUL156_41740 [Alteromonas sp. KUL156]|nr:hypothetical protein KUL154_09420 [Alteromonas sp. KUL154]GFE01582.1 hypothetical protein KUL156_41740 [Alteromonas sp. KUL156]
MKKILLLFLTVLIGVFQTFSQEKIKLKGVLMTNDYHKKITWVKSKPTPLVKKDFTVGANSVKNIQIYFGAKMEDGKQIIMPIRLVNNYFDTSWIFFDEVSYLLGSRKEIRQGKGVVFKIKDKETTRNTIGVEVHEQSDIEAIGEAKEFIKYVLENEETGLIVRYIDNDKGQYVDVKVPKGTKKLKKHFIALVESYNKLCELSKLEQRF